MAISENMLKTVKFVYFHKLSAPTQADAFGALYNHFVPLYAENIDPIQLMTLWTRARDMTFDHYEAVSALLMNDDVEYQTVPRTEFKFPVFEQVKFCPRLLNNELSDESSDPGLTSDSESDSDSDTECEDDCGSPSGSAFAAESEATSEASVAPLSDDDESESLKCKICDYVAGRKRLLNAHNEHHEGTGKYMCTICSYHAENKAHVNTHMAQHHAFSRKPVIESKSAEENIKLASDELKRLTQQLKDNKSRANFYGRFVVLQRCQWILGFWNIMKQNNMRRMYSASLVATMSGKVIPRLSMPSNPVTCPCLTIPVYACPCLSNHVYACLCLSMRQSACLISNCSTRG